MATGQLMFEVGIQKAQGEYDKIYNDVMELAKKGKDGITINLAIKQSNELEAFLKVLKEFGSGKELQPLIDKVARLQDRLAEMSDKGQYLDRLKVDAKAATRALEAYEKRLTELDQKAKTLRSHNQFEQAYSKEREATSIRNSQEYIDARNRQQQAADRLAAAEERLSNEERKAGASSSDLNTKIGELSASITNLSGKTFSVNMGNEFRTWAQEVQNVTASVRELVEQLQKMQTVTATTAKGGLEPLLSQAQAIESLKNKYNKLLKKKADSAGIMPTIGIDRELKDLEQKLPSAQAKFNESLEKGASVANSYAQAIQQLGQKYNHTGEQAQKLAEIIASGQLSTGNVQRGLKVGFNQATDIVNTIEALQKLKQEESKPAPQGGLFDPQQFKGLQEAIDAVIREINRLKEAFAGVGEIRGLSQLTESMNALFHNVSTFKDVFSTLSAAVNLTPTSEYVKKLQTDFEAAQAKVQELTEKLTALAAAQNNVAESASKAGKSEKQIGDAQTALFNRYQKVFADIQNIKREIVEIQRSAGGGGPFGDKLGEYFSVLNRIRNVVREIATAKDVPDAIAKGMSSELLARISAALANVKTQFKDTVSDAKAFNKATDKGSSQAEARIRKLGMAFNELKNYMRQNGGSEEMKRLQTEIQGAIRKMRDLMNAGNFAGAINVYERLSGLIRQAATATKEFEKGQQGLSSSVSHANSNLQHQSQILSDLKTMATQYLSVWGAQSFINNIIQTGGLLEQQRLSIGAILQNAGQATELFGKIKALAVQSPFGVVELDKMSKQLTAYGFEYKELYDWTKRLGDISAATGTGVDRLALALGHVRSEGALSGYTLRQFAMGNVPVLRMLSENLGISTKQVREKVRKKEISYEDVQNVLRQLTDEGGMFYQAQETMSQALNAKFKNLHDAFDIMYGEIAESGIGDALKRIAETLTAGAKEWGRYAKDLMGVAAAFGVAKAAMWAYNIAQAKGVNTSLNAVAVAAKQERENLRLAATYRELDAAEKSALGTKGALARAWYGLFAPMKLVSTEQLAVAISTKKLTQEELLRAVAMRKLNIEQAKAAILASKISRAQKAMMIGALNNVTVLGRWRIAMIGLGNAMKGVFSIAKTFAPLMAITAIMDMFARVSEMKDKAKEASSELAEKATSDLKVLGETFKELQDNGFIKSINSVSDKFINGKRVVSNVIQFDDSALNGKDLTQEINELKAKLQDMSPMYEGDLVDIDKMDNQVEQFKLIVRKLESIRHANDVTEAMSDVITDADVDIAGKNFFTRLFGDTYTQDVKDYESRLKDAEKDVNEINEQTIESIDKELGGQLENLRKKYSLDSKNSALSKLFSDWAKGSGLPTKYRDTNIEKYYDSVTKKAFSRSLSDQFSQMEADTKEMAAKLSSIVVTQFANDPDGAIYAVTNYIKKLMAMAGVTDPRVINEATAMMLDAMRKNLPQNLQTGVVDEMQRRILMEQFLGFLGNTITESTTPEEAEKALKKYSEMTIKWGEQMGIDLKKIGMDNAEAYRNGIEAKMNSVKIKIDWQKRASEVFVVNTVLKTNIDKNLDEFAQAVQKDLKAKQDYLARNKHHLKMTLNIDTDILMNADKLKAFMDSLAIQGQKKAMSGDWEGAQAIYSKIDKELKPYYDALVSVKEDKEWLKKEGYPETDPTKGNKKDPNIERAKAVREQVRVIKEAADAFQYWREKVGDKGAWEHVQKEFGDVLQKIGITATNIEDVREHLKKIPQTKEYQAITDKKVKTEIDKEIAKDNDQFIRKDFERDTERFLSKTQIELDNLTRSWEIFNSVREATGNVKLAVDLSGAQYAEGQTRNLADAIKQKLEQDFAESGAAEIPFDINLDDEKIKARIQKAIPQANEQKIKGFVEEYKKWRDLQRDVMKNDINTFAKLIGGLQDYGTQVGLVNIELELQKESLKKQRDEGKLTQEQYEKALKAAEQLAESKKFKMSAEYTNLMNHYLGLTNEQIKTASMAVQNDLNNSLKAGTITAEQYAEEMAKIEEIALKVKQAGLFGNNGSLATFIKGGIQGLQTKYTNSLAARRSELAQQGKSAEEIEKDEQVKKYKKISESLGDFQNVLNNAAATFTMVIGILNGLADAAQMLSDMFDATGNENLSNTWSDIGDSIGAVTSGLNSAVSAVTSAAQGNIGGVITGVVGIFTSPITAFAKLYDKRRQREIDAIKEQVKAINENTDAIKTYRNRTLGYDTNELRRLVGLQYRTAGFNMFGDNNPARVAMKEYYNTNTRGSGYAVELANLKEERKKIIEMYNIEEDKKKSSKDALNEYKQQIAELDEQILFYAEDLANELWGIDFKSWSSQISDAIWTAFENGEDAMEAFHDTAKDIISDVAKRMMNIHLIEPVFKALEDELFGKIDANGNRVGGAYNAQTGQFNENMTLEILGRFFGESGEFAKALDSAEKFYEMAERITGFDFSSDDDSSSSSKSIKGITEQTADLLVSYANACRADLSVIRTLDSKAVLEYWPSQIRLMTAGTQSLTNIEQHTLAIMRSSDAIERSNQAILDNINGLKSKTWSLPVA